MTIITGDQIAQYGLLVMRKRIQLEQKGLKCRGRSAKAMACDMFGISVRSSYDKVLKLLDEKIANQYLTG